MTDASKIYKLKEFAELLDVSVKTLQRWDKDGVLKACRTPANRRYYTYEQYLQVKGEAAKKYKLKEFAELLGVSVKTLQRWDKDEVLKAHRTPTNRLYYTYEQYIHFKEKRSCENDRKTVIYVRVLSKEQESELHQQKDLLCQFCNSKGIVIDQYIEEYGSGEDYDRQKWNQLLDDVIEQKIKTIIILKKDIFICSGYNWFERLCNKFHTMIIVADE